MKSSRRQKVLNHFSGLLLFAFIFVNAITAFAGPGRTTYQAKIVKPDGYPLEATNVNFKFTILDPAGSCILYSETYSSVNMSSTGGLISFSLGSGVKTYPVSATTFEQVFSNITPSLSCDTGGPASYSPIATDIRKIVMQFHDGTGWQTLPAMNINAVPYAMYANEATKLNGLTASDFVQVSTVPSCAASEALKYTGTGFTCIAVGNSVTSGTVITALGYTPADGVSVTALSSSLTTTNSDIASVSSTVFSVSSTVTSLQSSVATSFAAMTSSQWTTSGTNIFYNTGNIGIGTTTPVTKLDVSGGVRIGAESTTCAPALAGTLRYNASNVEYCNGTSWQAFGVSGAGLQSFNGSTSGTQSFATGTGGTAPNIVTANGVHTLNIPLASAGSVTAGLISNTDYTTFTNKITSSAASIAQVLGYVPADNAASGTYAQKANNLSDLTNIATARTNLGLGTFATANTVDLGSASATGTLAIARLPSFSGDATIAAASNTIILSNSGVTAGTYTKVAVDSKGRVTSSAALASSDITTALGYTPANSATTVSSQWITSATNIYYNTGNVGIGTTTPVTKLDVSGGVRIGAESTTCAPALAGTLRYNASNVEYCNGTTWSAFGVSSSGLTSLNGSTSQTQSFANGTGGTAPNIVTANGVHTLNIPNASTGSVTAGLISNTDYTTFTNKITSSAASIAQVLGYVPADNAASGTYAQKANNLSDLTNIATARTNLGLGTFATASSIDLGSASATGTLALARLPSFTGDATIAVASNTIILSNSGVTAGTYTKVTVDSKGRVTSSSALASSDVTTALGYTPANSATIVSSQWNTSGTMINYTNGNVGIGTTAPGDKLHVASGSILLDNAQYIKQKDDTGIVRAVLGTLSDGTVTLNGYHQNPVITAVNGATYFSGGSSTNMTISTGGNVGIGTTTPVTSLDVSGGVRISMETATCAVSFAGTLRYNASNVEYCNGTSWQAFGVSGAGLQSFNGSASGTQVFATGTGGTAPNFNTSNGVHTLNIPLASAGSVTAGLISNTDYTTFTNKITSSAASIAQVLGYVPADNAASGTYAQKTNNLSDLTNIATARTNLGLGTFATANSIDLGSASATGTLAVARLPAFTGDATTAAASNTIILSNSGVTAGTYTKVTVDNKGRVISSSALASSDVTTALGYTPANSATIVSSQWNTSGTTINYMNGNVGIGTSTPLSPLDVAVSDTSSGITLTNTNSTANRYPLIGVVNYADSTTGHPVLSMFNAQGTAAVPAALNAGMTLGTLLWSAQVTASQTMQGARIDAISDGSFAANTAPTRLTFSVAPASGNYVQRMVINSAGNVGIGTTAPSAKLHLSAGTSVTAALKFTSGTLLTAAQSGAMEYDGFNFYVTDSTNTRRTIATGSNSGTIDNASNINSSENITLTPTGSVVVSSTTTSTNSSTGALIVKGGLGVAENLNVAGTISGSAKVLATGFRANQGSPDSNDSSTNGYAFGADGDTGMFSPGSGAANGVLAFYGNNSEVMRLTNGNVGIGTTNPARKIHIKDQYPYMAFEDTENASGSVGTITYNQDANFYFDADNPSTGSDAGFRFRANGGTKNLLAITNSGNVGIGTTTPSYPLDVKNQMRIGAQGGSDVTLIAGGSGYGSQIYQYYADGVLKNVFSANGNSYITAGSLGIGTSAPTNVLHVKAPSTYATQTSQFAVGDSATDMKLNVGVGTDGTNKVSWVQSTEVSVSNDRNLALQPFGGKVGIGTTAPVNPFQTTMTSGAGNPYIGLNQTADNPYIELQRWTGSASNYEGVRLKNIVGSGGQFAIETTQNGGAAIGSQTFTERMRIVGGNVGIGTTSPLETLHIAGASSGSADQTLVQIGDPSSGSGPLYLTYNAPFISGNTYFNTGWKYGGGQGKPSSIGLTNGLSFYTADEAVGAAGTAANMTAKMTITSNGNVGIGTATPQAKLDVANATIRALDSATQYAPSGGRGLELLSLNGTGYIFPYDRTTSTYLPLRVDGSLVSIANGGTPVITVTGGDVGIGTASPGARLHIADYTTAGGKNLLVGDDSFLSDVDVSNTLGIYGNQDSTQGHIRLGSSGPLISGYSGFVGIGNTTPSYALDVSGDLRITGTPYRNGGDITWTVPSDARLKDVIRTYDRGLREIANLDMIIFKYKKDNLKQINSDKEYTGVIAQQVQEQIPEAVSIDKDGFLSLNTTPIFWAMINAIKELYNEVTGVSREVAAIKAENAELKKQNEEIKAYLCSQNPSAPICK